MSWLDYQPLFGNGARAPQTGLQKAAEIEPIHVTLDDDEQGDHDTTEIWDENCREFQHDDTS